MRLPAFGLLKLLVRAISTHAAHQAAIAAELRILNAHISRIWPPVPAAPAKPAAEPDLGNPEFDFGDIEATRDILQFEMGGRPPTDEQVIERLRVLADRGGVRGDVGARTS